jgi:hypothetical protein
MNEEEKVMASESMGESLPLYEAILGLVFQTEQRGRTVPSQIQRHCLREVETSAELGIK